MATIQNMPERAGNEMTHVSLDTPPVGVVVSIKTFTRCAFCGQDYTPENAATYCPGLNPVERHRAADPFCCERCARDITPWETLKKEGLVK